MTKKDKEEFPEYDPKDYSVESKAKKKIKDLEKDIDRKPYNKKTLEVLKGLLD